MSTNDAISIGPVAMKAFMPLPIAIVLGGCIIIIGLCSLAALVLLFQQFNRAKDCPPLQEAGAVVPARRTPKAIAATTQYRPLSEATRRHQALAARQPNLAIPLGRSPSSSSPHLNPEAASPTGPTSTSSPFDAPAAAINAPSPSPRPSVAAGDEPAVPSAPAPPAVATTAAPAPKLDRTSIGSCNSDSATGNPGSNPIDAIDLNLLSRIDQALASGVMRPQDATRILKSYGCDLQELLREEMEDPQHRGGPGASGVTSSSGGVVAVAQEALAPAPVIRASSAVGLSRPGRAPVFTSAPIPSFPKGRDVSPAKPTMPRSGLQPHMSAAHGHQPRPTSGDNSARGSTDGGGGGGGSITLGAGFVNSGSSGIPATAATTAAGLPIDDALLLKLDIALQSGAVRPEQATRLLQSYGCDLEELLREELTPGDIPVGGRAAPDRAAGAGPPGCSSGSSFSRDENPVV